MRRILPAFLLSVTAATPLALTGCGDLIAKLKGEGDAGAEAAAATPEAAAPTVTATSTDPAPLPPPTTTTTLAPAPTTVKPVLKDGGAADAAVADAGPKLDAGPAPAPTPTLTIPTNLFDGGFKFDAGGWKPPWQK